MEISWDLTSQPKKVYSLAREKKQRSEILEDSWTIEPCSWIGWDESPWIFECGCHWGKAQGGDGAKPAMGHLQMSWKSYMNSSKNELLLLLLLLFFPSLFNRGKPQNMTRPPTTRLNHTNLKTTTIRKWLESHPAKWWWLGDVLMHWVYHGLPHEITISRCQSLLITTIIPPFIRDFPIGSMMLWPCGCEPQQAAPVQETADEPEDLIAPEPLVRKMLQGGVNWCCNYQVGGCQNAGRGRHIVQTNLESISDDCRLQEWTKHLKP